MIRQIERRAKRALGDLLTPATVRHLHGPTDVDPEGLVVLSVVRDGERHVGDFIDHHLALGARHIVLLDNGSRDRTVAIAARSRQVTVLRSTLPFKHFKMSLKSHLVRRFGKGRWSLLADVDEHFDYPRSGRLGLADFLAYLSSRSFTDVRAQMCDMFAAGAIGAPAAATGPGWLRREYRLCDLSDVSRHGQRGSMQNVIADPRIEVCSGGIRRTLFGVDASLTKHPLVFLTGTVEPMSRSLHNISGAHIADVSAVLFHYKLIEGFAETVRDAVERGSHYGGSGEYRGYLAGLTRNPTTVARRETAIEITDVDDLVAKEFLVVSPAYEAWVAARGESAGPRS